MILRRLPDSRYSEVLPAWEGEMAVIIGGGGSLTKAQVETVRESDARTVAVNDAFLLADFADALYAADSHFHAWMSLGYWCGPNGERVPIDKEPLGMDAAEVTQRWAEFGGQKCTIATSGANVTDDRVHMLLNHSPTGRHSVGLSLDQRRLVTGHNSGFQALNLAVLAGAKRILLLGFDGQKGEKEHFHGGHPRPTPEAAYPLYRQAMDVAKGALEKAGVTVLNCTPGSAIKAFPRCDIQTALA